MIKRSGRFPGFLLCSALFLFMVVLPGCSERKSATDTSSSTENKSPLSAEDQTALAQRLAELNEMQRKERIREMREAFQVELPSKSKLQKSAWIHEVRGEKERVALRVICDELKRSNTLHYAIEELDSERSDAIRWSDVGMDSAAGKTAYKKTVVEIAKSLIGVFSLSRDLREKAEPCREVNELLIIEFADSSSVMQGIIQVLATAGLEPKDMGSSTRTLQQALLKDFQARIAELRLTNKADEDTRARVREKILEIAQDAIKEWNFTWRELGLTPEEAIELKR